jgi:hypothetical protein
METTKKPVTTPEAAQLKETHGLLTELAVEVHRPGACKKDCTCVGTGVEATTGSSVAERLAKAGLPETPAATGKGIASVASRLLAKAEKESTSPEKMVKVGIVLKRCDNTRLTVDMLSSDQQATERLAPASLSEKERPESPVDSVSSGRLMIDTDSSDTIEKKKKKRKRKQHTQVIRTITSQTVSCGVVQVEKRGLASKAGPPPAVKTAAGETPRTHKKSKKKKKAKKDKVAKEATPIGKVNLQPKPEVATVDTKRNNVALQYVSPLVQLEAKCQEEQRVCENEQKEYYTTARRGRNHWNSRDFSGIERPPRQVHRQARAPYPRNGPWRSRGRRGSVPPVVQQARAAYDRVMHPIENEGLESFPGESTPTVAPGVSDLLQEVKGLREQIQRQNAEFESYRKAQDKKYLQQDKQVSGEVDRIHKRMTRKVEAVYKEIKGETPRCEVSVTAAAERLEAISLRPKVVAHTGTHLLPVVMDTTTQEEPDSKIKVVSEVEDTEVEVIAQAVATVKIAGETICIEEELDSFCDKESCTTETSVPSTASVVSTPTSALKTKAPASSSKGARNKARRQKKRREEAARRSSHRRQTVVPAVYHQPRFERPATVPLVNGQNQYQREWQQPPRPAHSCHPPPCSDDRRWRVPDPACFCGRPAYDHAYQPGRPSHHGGHQHWEETQRQQPSPAPSSRDWRQSWY